MEQIYKIGIIGLGSIGTRHLQNITQVLAGRNKACEIDLIRSGKGKEPDTRLEPLVTGTVCSYANARDDYDAVFIANPTHRHCDTIKQFVPKAKHMFIEKPVFDTTSVCLEGLKLKDGGVYYVACPLRYTGVIKYLKENINPDDVYSARAICSSYLPEWRAGTDYTASYSAHRDMGGGVSIDLIHEWDYLRYLFGTPKRVCNMKGTFSNLEIDSDDLSLYIAEYKDKLVEVHLDYFGRKTIREVQLFTQSDTVTADITNSEIRFLKQGKTLSFREEKNDFYIREIEAFFDMLEGKATNHNDISMALETLRIAKGE